MYVPVLSCVKFDSYHQSNFLSDCNNRLVGTFTSVNLTEFIAISNIIDNNYDLIFSQTTITTMLLQFRNNWFEFLMREFLLVLGKVGIRFRNNGLDRILVLEILHQFR